MTDTNMGEINAVVTNIGPLSFGINTVTLNVGVVKSFVSIGVSASVGAPFSVTSVRFATNNVGALSGFGFNFDAGLGVGPAIEVPISELPGFFKGRGSTLSQRRSTSGFGRGCGHWIQLYI